MISTQELANKALQTVIIPEIEESGNVDFNCQEIFTKPNIQVLVQGKQIDNMKPIYYTIKGIIGDSGAA